MPSEAPPQNVVHDLTRLLWRVPSYGLNPHWFRSSVPACPFPVPANGLWDWGYNLWPGYGRELLNVTLARTWEHFAVTGDENEQIVQIGLTGLNQLNSDAGTLYWSLHYTGAPGDKTVTLRLYRDCAHTELAAEGVLEHWDEVFHEQALQISGPAGIVGRAAMFLTGDDDDDPDNTITPQWETPVVQETEGAWEAALALKLEDQDEGELACAEAAEEGEYQSDASEATVRVGLGAAFPASSGAPRPRFNTVETQRDISGAVIWDGPELWFSPGRLEIVRLQP